MKIINGKQLAANLNSDLSNKIAQLKFKYGKTPYLVVIIVGDNPASHVYVRNKEKKALEVGIKSLIVKLDKDIEEKNLLNTIHKYNDNDEVDGILVQLPLPAHINTNRIIDEIRYDKDVDGFNSKNIGLLALGRPTVIPCTPLGCFKMLEHATKLEGKNAIVLGRSNIVGKPLSYLLTNKNVTVTLAHSKTRKIEEICKNYDIIIAAIGKPNFVKKEWVNKKTIVIDVGINVLKRQDGSSFIVGDVDYEEVSKNVSAISPVPGGVGPMTIHCLLLNTFSLAKKRNNLS